MSHLFWLDQRHALPGQGVAGQNTVQVSQRHVCWTENARGPTKHSRGPAAALGEVAGRKALNQAAVLAAHISENSGGIRPKVGEQVWERR